MMDKLIDEVKECIEREYGRAGAKYGLLHHSDHQSYAVLLEEFEEAQDEVFGVKEAIDEFWNFVKGDVPDDDKFIKCNTIQTRALLAACELIQVAAMAKKASITICDRNAIEELKGE